MKTQLHIGEVAKLLGITPKTIRHYHKVGLLTEPQRTESGYRLYYPHLDKSPPNRVLYKQKFI